MYLERDTQAPHGATIWQGAMPAPGLRLGAKRVTSGPMTQESDTGEAARRRAEWLDEMLAVRDGRDASAFAALFRHFAPRVKAFLISSGSPPAAAEDLAQEVMTTLWRKAHLYDPARASVATWVFTIARNRRIDALRREKRPEPEDLPWGPEPEPDQAEVLELAEESARLGAAIAELPKKQREMIRAAYFAEKTQAEIAEETGLPLGTIKSRVRLALDRLRHAMEKER